MTTKNNKRHMPKKTTYQKKRTKHLAGSEIRYIERKISKELKTNPKNILILGPRQVGKSTLIHKLKPDISINLSNEIELLKHSSDPGELIHLIKLQKAKTVYIDEIQRLPKMLNTIQDLVDKDKGLKFFLTGSSARKLKRGGANLLPGRLLNYNLGPLVSCELNYNLNTKTGLELGTLPEIYLSENIKLNHQILMSYAANYLKEEIRAEALVRDLDSFSRFLNAITLLAAQFVDYSKLAKNAKISRHACPRYFEILQETMLGYLIFPFNELIDQTHIVKHPKFYFFDNGVFNGLLGNFVASLDRIGVLSEQLIFSQLIHSAYAQNKHIKISTFRLRNGTEVDFIITINQNVYAIEVKTSDNLKSEDSIGLYAFKEAYPNVKDLFIFHLGSEQFNLGAVKCLPWQIGLKKIGL